MQYLYGASIHGIQDIIFETNKLKEIRGASEIIEMICKEFHSHENLFATLGLTEDNFILQAAGNIKLVADEEKIKKIVKYFPMKVAKLLPGIVVSQAVVKIDNGMTSEDLKCLNKRLKIQRNRIMRTGQAGYSAVKRAQRTGRPTYKHDNVRGEFIDFATAQKIQYAKKEDRFQNLLLENENENLVLADNEEKIASDHNKNWLAVCHADGNGLGQILIEIAKNTGQLSTEKIIEVYRNFSQQIEKANEKAFKEAFHHIVLENTHDEKQMNTHNKKYSIPFRPILMGGDDLTFICRADLAVPFLTKYIEYFEKYTDEELSCEIKKLANIKSGLTACAGVAFIKKNYPFHYGYSLAEELCAHAKKISRENKKNNIPSSLAFHKVHSSFHCGYQDIASRELTIGNTSLQFGPYAINNNQANMPQIHSLLKCACELQKQGAPKSGLRRWLDELANEQLAQQLLERIFSITEENSEFNLVDFSSLLKKLDSQLDTDPNHANLIVKNADIKKTPIYDLLTLISVGEV